MLLVSTLIWTAAAAVASDVLTVDVTAGGLGRAAIILTGRHGVAVNYEGVPRVVEGVSFRREINGDGVLAPLPISHTLRFEYPANATPREAAEAAVTAWNATPQREAHYRVLDSDGMLHFTPFEVLTVAGTYEPYVSLLDAELVLDRTVGTPTKLRQDIVAELAETTGTAVRDGDADVLLGSANVPWDHPLSFRQEQFDVTLPERGSARSLLDAVLRSNDVQTNWMLLWLCSDDPSATHWGISFAIAKPEDEATLNRTPIIPVEPVAP